MALRANYFTHQIQTMKKILSLCVALAMFAMAATSQSTTPRFGITPNQDNTGRALTYKYVAKTDVAGVDTLKTVPNAWTTIYRVTLTDTLSLQVTSVTKCFTGDQIQVVASGASGLRLKFVGTNWITAGVVNLSTLGRAVVHFVFDGSKWVEASRVVQ